MAERKKNSENPSLPFTKFNLPKPLDVCPKVSDMRPKASDEQQKPFNEDCKGSSLCEIITPLSSLNRLKIKGLTPK